MNRRLPRTVARVACAALLALAACASPPEDGGPPPPPDTLGRWTEEFLDGALLVAEEIEVEGPPALRDHLVLPQDPAATTSRTTATDLGLLHVIEARSGRFAEIRAHLDKWEIVATRRLKVLERPGEVDVRIVARGRALLHPFGGRHGSEPREGAELVFVGALTP